MFKDHENTLILESNLPIFWCSVHASAALLALIWIFWAHIFWVPEPGVHWVGFENNPNSTLQESL